MIDHVDRGAVVPVIVAGAIGWIALFMLAEYFRIITAFWMFVFVLAGSIFLIIFSSRFSNIVLDAVEKIAGFLNKLKRKTDQKVKVKDN